MVTVALIVIFSNFACLFQTEQRKIFDIKLGPCILMFVCKTNDHVDFINELNEFLNIKKLNFSRAKLEF